MKERSAKYSKGSLSLLGTIAMGTGVMIGAGIFALTGQVAELAGGLFPIAFVVAAAISGFGKIGLSGTVDGITGSGALTGAAASAAPVVRLVRTDPMAIVFFDLRIVIAGFGRPVLLRQMNKEPCPPS